MINFIIQQKVLTSKTTVKITMKIMIFRINSKSEQYRLWYRIFLQGFFFLVSPWACPQHTIFSQMARYGIKVRRWKSAWHFKLKPCGGIIRYGWSMLTTLSPLWVQDYHHFHCDNGYYPSKPMRKKWLFPQFTPWCNTGARFVTQLGGFSSVLRLGSFFVYMGFGFFYVIS